MFLTIPFECSLLFCQAVGILASIGVLFKLCQYGYRLTLHPLTKYPGPFLAKLTSLYPLYHAYIGDMHIDFERCHKKYGNFVRYGPDSLIVNSTTGFNDIYSTHAKVKKAQSYVAHGQGNILGLRDKVEYARKKKMFALGFSDSALRLHEPKVIEIVDLFCEKMVEGVSKGQWSMERNMSPWCFYLTTDIMTKVVFTACWDLVASTKNHVVLKTISTVMRLIGCVHQSSILYEFRMIFCVLILPHLWWSAPSLAGYAERIIEERKKIEDGLGEGEKLKDIFSHYSGLETKGGVTAPVPRLEVLTSSATMIIGGSDTASSSLAATFFYLSRSPSAYAKVRDEVRNTFPTLASIRAGPLLNSCIYLRAAIDEAQRMSPLGCQPLWREVESSGAVIDGDFIPAGINVGAGMYRLHHNESFFPDPFTYNIERWIPTNDSPNEKARVKGLLKSFAPFSAGPRMCIAKNFAAMELLLTMANVFWRLDFESTGTLGEGRKGLGVGREREGEFQLRSFFTSRMDGPMIRFKRREDI